MNFDTNFKYFGLKSDKWAKPVEPSLVHENCNHTFAIRTTNQQVHWVVQVINLTWVRVDPTEIVGLKQAMVILVNLSQADSNGYEVLIIKI